MWGVRYLSMGYREVNILVFVVLSLFINGLRGGEKSPLPGCGMPYKFKRALMIEDLCCEVTILARYFDERLIRL
jgi:hypothetical protein